MLGSFFQTPLWTTITKGLKRLSIILVVVGIGGYVAYWSHNEYTKKLHFDATLNFYTEKPWAWHGYDSQIQYNESLKRSMLRKISEDKSYILYVYKNEDYSYNFRILFLTKCIPRSKITTTQKEPSGQPKILICNDSGDGLAYDFRRGPLYNFGSPSQVYDYLLDGATPHDLNGDLDGFKFRENLANWDFSKLDQEITLLKATAPPKAD